MDVPVMTFNIQHGVDYNRVLSAAGTAAADGAGENPAGINLSQVAQAIRQCGAEIVALNEVRDVMPGVVHPCFTPQVRILAEAAGFPYAYFGRAIDLPGQGLYGNGLLSKHPIRSACTVMVPDSVVKDEPAWYETRCVIRAEIDIIDPKTGVCKPLTVLVTHMGLASSEQKNAVQTVLEQRVPGEATLLMGDFNLEPDSPILAPLFEVFRDAAVLLPPDTRSYPSDNPDCKIDYILADGPVTFLKAAIPPLVVSDHRPHTAVIAL